MATPQIQIPLDLKSISHSTLKMIEQVLHLVHQDARTVMENSYCDAGWPNSALATDRTLDNFPLLSEIWRQAYYQAVWEIDEFFRAIAESEDDFNRFCQQCTEEELLSTNVP